MCRIVDLHSLPALVMSLSSKRSGSSGLRAVYPARFAVVAAVAGTKQARTSVKRTCLWSHCCKMDYASGNLVLVRRAAVESVLSGWLTKRCDWEFLPM